MEVTWKYIGAERAFSLQGAPCYTTYNNTNENLPYNVKQTWADSHVYFVEKRKTAWQELVD